MKKPLLLLFDGHALVHRAFHALPPLSVSKTGEPTGAVYGFVRMLLKTVQDLKPTHWAIAFDRPALTFRHLEFEEYKAQRPEAPDDLRRQFGRVRQVVKAFNVPTFEMDGYEADDLLGTLARQAAAQGIDTIIVSGDNDMLQLISPRVKVLLPKRTFGETTLYDTTAVHQKLGIAPEQIPDFKGLKGDPSDNIPGVPGVGEKTAARLIQLYGSVEGIYEHIDEVTPPKLRETLLAEKDKAKRSKMLATIRTDAPVDFDPVRCQTTAVNRSELVPLFRELEFFSLANKLPELGEPTVIEAVAPPPSAGADREECVLVDTTSALEELVARLPGTASFVIHLVTRLMRARSAGAAIAGIALCLPKERAYYLPVAQGVWDTAPQLDLQQTLERLRPVLSDARIAKLAHNGKEVISKLAECGVTLTNLEFDTMIAAYLLGQKSVELKDLAPSKLGIEITSPADQPGLSAVAQHACQQASVISRLHPLLQREMDEKQLSRLFQGVEMPLVPVIVRMERNGVALDVDLLRHLSQNLGTQLVNLEQEIYGYAGHRFNINSPQQLGGVLFAELKLPGAKKTKTGYSTDASILEGLREANPIVNLILEYRQLSKLKSTYIDALPALINPATRRVHTSFNQTVTATGRLSSSEPNLQNVPIRGEFGRQIRQAFIAEPPWFLVSADYSQIDLRVLAHLSQDLRLLTAFRQDEDIHAATASEVFGVGLADVTPETRRTAKVVNFGVIYGMSGYGLEQATELSREEAVRFIASYFEKYPGVKDYLERTKRQAKEDGFVQTLLGRRRYIADLHSSNRQVREAAERMAINMPVQGTSADIIKVAMINLQREMDRDALKSKMILQIHDELLFEVPPEELDRVASLTARTMSQAMELSIPLKVEVKVGRNWGDMELHTSCQ